LRHKSIHRILIVLYSLAAEGTPILALDMAKEWRRHGIDFRVCTFKDSPADLAEEFKQAGIEVESLGVRFAGYGKFPTLIWRIFKYCRRNRIDAVLSFPFGWHSYVAWGGKLAGAQKVVAHAGNYPPFNSQGSIRRLRATLALGRIWATHIACCSDHVRDGVERLLHVPGELLHTVYNGINLQSFTNELRVHALHKPLRLGMVARFDRDQPTLIRAVSLLLQRGEEIHLDLVGDGGRRAEFESLAKELGVHKHIRFTGVRRDIPELLREWDVFVFSVMPDEGLGIALIEALASGVPVIASDVGACREVLFSSSDGNLGELFPFGDAVALADAILRFRSDPELWWNRARRASASVQARFSIESMADKYLRLLGAS